MIGNINIVNKRVATKLGLPDKKIKEINETYFKFLRRTLSNGTAPNYYVRDFGTFSVDLSSIRHELYIIIKMMRKTKRSTKFYPEKKASVLEEYSKNFRTLWKQYDNLRLQMLKQKEQYEKTKLLWNLTKASNDTEGIHPSTIQEEPIIVRDPV